MSLASWNTTLEFAVAYSIFALSVYASLSVGVLSVVSIGSGAIGGFLFAGLLPGWGAGALLLLLCGALAGMAFALAISLPLLRLSSHFIAFATIAVLLVVNTLVINLPSVTGGVEGEVVGGPFGWPALIAVLVLCSWIFARLRRSRFGLAGAVIREDPLVASVLGINPRTIQRLAFLLSGMTGGAAGVLLANLLRFVDPQTFYLPLAFTSLAAIVLGSAYHWQGAIVGGLVFTLLPQLLNSYLSPDYDQVINGALIIVIILFLPAGLYDVRRWTIERMRSARLEPGPLIPRTPDDSIETMDVDQGSEVHSVIHRHADAVALSAVAEPSVSDGPPIVRVSDLSKSFGGVRAVSNLTLAVDAGTIFGVLGPNGAGKTTLINLLSGVFAPDAGTITALDNDVTGWSAHRIARLGMARTYQNIRLSLGLNIIETIISGAYYRGRSTMLGVLAAAPSERRERRAFADEARELMETVGITSPPERLAQTLPYGEQRRVEIARALASRPSVLLLDEPTAGMNARESAALGELFRALITRGVTVIMIEHNVRLVAEFCDKAAVMHIGELLAHGDPRTCLSDPDVQTAYFGRRSDAERIQALRVLRLDPSR